MQRWPSATSVTKLVAAILLVAMSKPFKAKAVDLESPGENVQDGRPGGGGRGAPGAASTKAQHPW
jgi:hypothetical protein